MRFHLPLAALAFIASTASYADNGTITFSGSVIAAACDIPTPNLDIPMGTVTQSALPNIGAVAATKSFQIELTGCPDLSASGLTTLSVAFSGERDNDNHNLLSLDESSTAEGIAIGLYENDNTAININNASKPLTLQQGDIPLQFIAKIVATKSSITAGNFTATTDFSITYN